MSKELLPRENIIAISCGDFAHGEFAPDRWHIRAETTHDGMVFIFEVGIQESTALRILEWFMSSPRGSMTTLSDGNVRVCMQDEFIDLGMKPVFDFCSRFYRHRIVFNCHGWGAARTRGGELSTWKNKP